MLTTLNDITDIENDRRKFHIPMTGSNNFNGHNKVGSRPPLAAAMMDDDDDDFNTMFLLKVRRYIVKNR